MCKLIDYHVGVTEVANQSYVVSENGNVISLHKHGFIQPKSPSDFVIVEEGKYHYLERKRKMRLKREEELKARLEVKQIRS